MTKSKKRIIAFLMAFTMVLSVCVPSSGISAQSGYGDGSGYENATPQDASSEGDITEEASFGKEESTASATTEEVVEAAVEKVYAVDPTVLVNGLASATITADKNEAGKYVIESGERYKIRLSFAEDGFGYQFANDDSQMIYDLPDGLEGVDCGNGSSTKNITISVTDAEGNFKLEGNQYSISDGQLYFKFNTDDPNFDRLTACANAKVSLEIEATVRNDVTEIDFGNDIRVGIDMITDKGIDAVKYATYNAYTGKVYYTVNVETTGTNNNVEVTDTIIGTALKYDIGSIRVDNQAVSATESDSGFTYTIPQMKHGKTAKITYSASVDYSQISDNGTIEQTGNVVTVTSDEVTDPAVSSASVSGQISYDPSLTKGAGTTSTSADGKTTIPWTVTLNGDYKYTFGGNSISDSISADSQKYMKYSGTGITVTKYAKDTEGNESVVSTTTKTWAELGASDSEFTYAIPTDDTTPYKYVVTYNTVAENNTLKDVNLGNTAYVGDSENPVKSVGSSKPLPATGETLAISKSGKAGKTSDSATYKDKIDWTVSFNVAANKEYSSCVITDTYPATYFDDLGLVSDTMDYSKIVVTGLTSPESYTISSDDANRRFIITFYQDAEKTIPGLIKTDKSRNITITYPTSTNKDWYDRSTKEDLRCNHTNQIRIDVGDIGLQEQAVVPVYPELPVSITKNACSGEKTGEYYYEDGIQTYDVWGNMTKYPIYKFTILLTGGVQDGMVVSDSFDTSILEYMDGSDVTLYGATVAGLTHAPTLKGGNQYNYQQNSDGKLSAEKTSDGVKFTLTKLPTNSGYIVLTYYLYVKNKAALDKLRSDPSGQYVISNTASCEGEVSSDTIIFSDPSDVSKMMTQEATAENDYKAKYNIVINPDKLTYGTEKTLTVTDSFTGQRIKDDADITITTDPAGKESEVKYTQSNTQLIFTIPNSTKVTINYQATVVGNGATTYSNTVNFVGHTKSTSQSVDVQTSEEGSADNPGVYILKHTYGSDADRLEGAKFRLDIYRNDVWQPVTDKDGKEVTVITDADGKVFVQGDFKNLGWALFTDYTYRLYEIETPEGYAPDEPTIFTIKSSILDSASNQVVNGDTIYISNMKENFHLVKTDRNDLTKKLSGATYKLTSTEGASVYERTVTSGADGVIAFSGLKEGTYTLVETAAPEGYEIDNTVYTITVSDQLVITSEDLEFSEVEIGSVSSYEAIVQDAPTEAPTGTIEVTKQFSLNSTIKPVTIGVYTDSLGKTAYLKDGVAYTVTLTENDIKEGNKAVFSGLPYGTYYVYEVDNLKNPVVGNDIHATIAGIIYNVTSTLTAGAVLNAENKKTEVTITNSEVKVDVTIDKRDITGGVELAGAKLVVKDGSTEIASWESKTGENKTISGLTPGKVYSLEETTAPAGYNTIVSTVYFKVDDRGVVTVVNEDGSAKTISNKFTADASVSDTGILLINDQPKKGSIKVTKVYSEGSTVKPVMFGLFKDQAGTTFEYDKSGIGTKTLSADDIKAGKQAVFEGIPYGTYYVYEMDGATPITTNGGKYTIDSISYTVTGVEGATVLDSPEATKTITNTEDKVSVTIDKWDITGDVELEGAVLVVKDGTTTVDTWTSELNETHTITGLTPGRVYSLEETIAPVGYNTITTTVYFKIDDAGNVTVVNADGSVKTITDNKTADASVSETGVLLINDQPKDKVSVKIEKWDIAGNVELEGAKLVVYDGSTTVDTWTSELNETHTITGLTPGKVYSLEETTAPTGYNKITTTVYFKINDAGNVTLVEDATGTTEKTNPTGDAAMTADATVRGGILLINDQPKIGSIKVTKVYSEGSTVKTVVFGLFKDEAGTIPEYGSSAFEINTITLAAANIKNGQPAIFEDIPYGTYYVYEMDGDNPIKTNGSKYTIDAISYTVTGVEGAVELNSSEATKTITNTEDKVSVKINKCDATGGNEELEGAIIEIKKGDTVVGSWTSEIGKVGEVSGLTSGVVYELKETTAPEGYEKITTSTYFVVDKDGKVKTTDASGNAKTYDEVVVTESGVLLVNDQPSTVTVKINKCDATGGNEELEGAVIEIKKGDTVVGSWTSEIGKVGEVSGLTPGVVYELKETTAPEGYEKITTSTYFVVDKDGNVKTTDASGNAKTYDEVVVTESGVLLVNDQPKKGEFTPEATKVFSGDTLSGGSSYTFNFNLYEGTKDGYSITATPIQTGTATFTATSDEAKAITGFTKITYGPADIGDHYYYIREIAGEDTKVTYDDTSYLVKVTVADSETTSLSVTTTIQNFDTKEAATAVAFTNTYAKDKVSVTIDKWDITGNVELEGAVLIVKDGTTTVDTWTSEIGKTHTISELTPGKVYSLEETTAPTGYNTITSTVYFKIDDAGNVTVVNSDGSVKTIGDNKTADASVSETGVLLINDQPKTVSVTIDKRDITNDVELGGALLVVKDGETEVASWESKTGENKTISGLAPGKVYSLEETTAPTGYNKITTTVYFKIDDAGKVTVVNSDGSAKTITDNKTADASVSTENVLLINDQPKTVSVTIDKRYITGDVELAGALLVVKDGETEIASWESKTGENKTISGLTPGKVYSLEETTAPAGYNTITSTVYFKIDDEGKVTVVNEDGSAKTISNKNTADASVSDTGILLINDQPKKGKISLVKIFNNRAVALVTVRIYKDAEATTRATYASGEIIADINLSPNGTGSLRCESMMYNIPFGTYYIYELDNKGNPVIDTTNVVTLNGVEYVASYSSESVKVESETAPAEYTITNTIVEPANVYLTATKILNGKALAADEFEFVLQKTDESYQALSSVAPITAKNDASGNVSFEAISLAEEGTYYYTVSEKIPTPKDLDITYDTTVYKVKIVVTRDTDRKLKAAVTIDGETDKDITFENTLKKDIIVTKMDVANSEEVEGATLVVKDTNKTEASDDDVVIATWISAKDDESTLTVNESKQTVSGLIPGHVYSLEETVTPYGYATVSTIFFTVDTDGKVTLVTDETGVTEKTNPTGEAAKTAPASVSDDGTLLVNDTLLVGKIIIKKTFVRQATSLVKVGIYKNPEATERATYANGNEIEIIHLSPNGIASLVCDDETISNIPYGTYYIYELDNSGNPVIDTTKIAMINNDYKVTYSSSNGTGCTAVIDAEHEAVEYSITNTAVDAAYVSLSATKTYTNGTLNGDDFSFKVTELVDNDGVYVAKEGGFTETVKNDASGNIKFTEFGKIGYATEGTYYYSVKEVIPETKDVSITYDTNEYIVTVVVTYDGTNAKYVANVSGIPENGIKFTNTYTAPASTEYTPGAKKELIGRELKAGEFTFALYAANESFVDLGTNLGEATNDADGNITFAKQTYSTEGSRYYLIKEKVPTPKEDGITYDTKVYGLKVVVERSTEENKLVATPYYYDLESTSGESATTVSTTPKTFINTYTAPGSATIVVNKVVAAGYAGGIVMVPVPDGVFKFNLLDEDDKVLQTITWDSTKENNGAFAPIEYQLSDVDKTFNYTILEQEIPDTANGDNYEYSRDPVGHRVTVKVEKNAEGKIVTTVKYGVEALVEKDDLTYEEIYNTYTEYITKSLVIDKKLIKDKEEVSPEAGEFEFNMRQVYLFDNEFVTPVGPMFDVYSKTVSCDANGKITFDGLEYYSGLIDQPQYYILCEVSGDEKDIDYDPAEYLYIVTPKLDTTKAAGERLYLTEEFYKISDYDNSSEVSIIDQIKGSSSKLSTVTFTNYEITDGSVKLAGVKAYNDTEDEFTFNMVEVDTKGNALEGAKTYTATTNGAGKFEFEELTFDADTSAFNETHYYKITEASDSSKAIIYDDTVYYVAVIINYDSDEKKMVSTIGVCKKLGESINLADEALFVNYSDSSITFTNTATELSVAKVDQFGEPVVGAKLVIKDLLGVNTVAEFETKATAEDVSKKIIPGVFYKLSEVEVPKGYYAADDIVFYIGTDNVLYVYDVETDDYVAQGKLEITMVDEKITIGNIKFTKTGYFNEKCSAKANETKALNGVKFGLYMDAECTTLVAGAESKTIDGVDGVVLFEKIPFGTYYIKEIETLTGYKLSEEVIKVEVTAANIEEPAKISEENVVINDIITTDIKLKKVNEQKEEETLPNSKYGLYTETELGTKVEIATAVTNEEGMITFAGVIPGKPYTIKELEAPNGSYVSELPVKIEFEIDPSTGKIKVKEFDPGKGKTGSTARINEEGEITWLEPSVCYAFEKVDEDGNPVSGAKLQIVDKDGKEIASWTTDGTAYRLDRVLVIGETYTLKELEAPEGYQLAEDVTFTVDDSKVGPGEDKVITIKMVDKSVDDITETTTESTTSTTTETVTTEKTTESGSGSSAKTGDDTPVLPVAILFTISAAGLVVVGKRRKKEEEE